MHGILAQTRLTNYCPFDGDDDNDDDTHDQWNDRRMEKDDKNEKENKICDDENSLKINFFYLAWTSLQLATQMHQTKAWQGKTS